MKDTEIITEKDFTYYINRVTRTVVAIYRPSKLTPHFISKCFSPIFKYVEIKDSAYKLPKLYRGIARCHAEDFFDEDTGKQIASCRAYSKYCVVMENYLEHFLNSSLLCTDTLQQQIFDLDWTIHDTNRKLGKLVGESNNE